MSNVDPRLTLLPPTMRPLGERIGVERTAAFMRAFGGRRIYVGKRALAKSAVWEHDRVTAQALSAIYGGQIIVVPIGTELDRAVARMKRDADIRADTRSDSVVAHAYGLARRTVEKIRAGTSRVDERQSDLFTV